MYSRSYFLVVLWLSFVVFFPVLLLAQEESWENIDVPTSVESSPSPQTETAPSNESSTVPPIETTNTTETEVETETTTPTGTETETTTGTESDIETVQTNDWVPTESTSSITLIDTGDGIVPIVDWPISEETAEIVTLFSNNDVFVEIEVIFSDLDTEVDEIIQNDPTLADNTDEDPNVDLIDPSIVSDPPGPIPEIEPDVPPEDDTPVIESQTESHSILALLDSLSEKETLSIRTYDKDIMIDPDATHTCRTDIFRADFESWASSRARVTLVQNKKKNLPSLLEIGALPPGLNVLFKANEEYTYAPGTRETVIEFDITRQIGAWEWDFTIPIIYTLTGDSVSSVVCQINIIND